MRRPTAGREAAASPTRRRTTIGSSGTTSPWLMIARQPPPWSRSSGCARRRASWRAGWRRRAPLALPDHLVELRQPRKVEGLRRVHVVEGVPLHVLRRRARRDERQRTQRHVAPPDRDGVVLVPRRRLPVGPDLAHHALDRLQPAHRGEHLRLLANPPRSLELLGHAAVEVTHERPRGDPTAPGYAELLRS